LIKRPGLVRAATAVAFSVLVMSAPVSASAQAYLGAGLGKSDAGCAFIGDGVSCGDERSGGYLLFGGYDFNTHLAIDATHVKHGEIVSGYYGPGFSPDGKATSIAAKGAIPVGDHVSLFARAGLARWKFEGSTSGALPQRASSGTDPVYGVGFEYIVNVLGVRLQWERTEFGAIDVDTMSAGIVVKF
jgi:hypothetical protein